MARTSRSSDSHATEAARRGKRSADPAFKPLALPAVTAAVRAVSRRHKPAPKHEVPPALRKDDGEETR